MTKQEIIQDAIKILDKIIRDDDCIDCARCPLLLQNGECSRDDYEVACIDAWEIAKAVMEAEMQSVTIDV